MSERVSTPSKWALEHERCSRLWAHDPHVWFTNGATTNLAFFGRWCNG